MDPRSALKASARQLGRHRLVEGLSRFRRRALQTVARARALGLLYVYLGYWVPESRKMSYKSRYRPSEVLMGGVWRVLETAG